MGNSIVSEGSYSGGNAVQAMSCHPCLSPGFASSLDFLGCESQVDGVVGKALLGKCNPEEALCFHTCFCDF